MISSEIALQWVEKLTAIAIFLQTIELLLLRGSFSAKGVWRWSTLQKEYTSLPFGLFYVFQLLFDSRGLFILLILRSAVSITLFYSPSAPVVLILLLTTLLICIRWRGTFNGGSDYMTVVLLTALSLIYLLPNVPQIQKAGLWYISIHLCASYFVAGLCKILRSGWRNGSSLKSFFLSKNYSVPDFLKAKTRSSLFMKLLCWSVLLFEISFPVVFLSSQVAIVYLFAAVGFHLGTVYAFGLNRFLHIWVATYPALLFCVHSIS